MIALDRSALAGDAVEIAPQLLNKLIITSVGGDRCAGRIVEVEAYREDDPASHSFAGPTPRNATMFGPAGHLYVYFIYGMHYCANVVTGPTGDGAAVLIRAVTPVEGADVMMERRGRRPLADGPGKLCQALGIGPEHDGADVCRTGGTVWLASDGVAPPTNPHTGPRVGISKAIDRPWRWRIVADRKN